MTNKSFTEPELICKQCINMLVCVHRLELERDIKILLRAYEHILFDDETGNQMEYLKDKILGTILTRCNLIDRGC